MARAPAQDGLAFGSRPGVELGHEGLDRCRVLEVDSLGLRARPQSLAEAVNARRRPCCSGTGPQSRRDGRRARRPARRRGRAAPSRPRTSRRPLLLRARRRDPRRRPSPWPGAARDRPRRGRRGSSGSDVRRERSTCNGWAPLRHPCRAPRRRPFAIPRSASSTLDEQPRSPLRSRVTSRGSFVPSPHLHPAVARAKSDRLSWPNRPTDQSEEP